MKVLVAGATGVLGRVAVPLLLAQGHTVVALARNAASAQALAAQGAEPLIADILQPDGLFDAALRDARGTEAVLHLATVIPHDPKAPGAWLPNDRVRVDGTRNLLDLAGRLGAVRYIQQSITRIYQDQGSAWIDEASPLADRQPLHLESTISMEGLVRAAGGEMQTVILRGGQFYGSGTSTTEKLLDAARSGMLRLDGRGDHFISPVHPADMAQAVVLALNVPEGVDVLNVVDDSPLTQQDFFATLCGIVNPACAVEHGDRSQKIPSRRCSNAKIRSLGFRPAFPSCREGLADAHARHQAGGKK